MLETKEQKQNLAVAGVLLVILLVITLASKPNFRYKEPPQAVDANQSVVDARQYLSYLENLKIDPAASKRLFEEILTEDNIRHEVEAELAVNQAIVEPQIDAGLLERSSKKGQAATVDYLAKLTGSALNFNVKAGQTPAALFTEDANALEALKAEQQKVLEEFFALPAPSEAAELQESVVRAFVSYGKLIDTALAYASRSDNSPWPNLYNEYSVINDNFKTTDSEIKKLADKYNIAALPITPVYAFEDDTGKFHLIKHAQAFLGIGDVSITVGDIPRIIKEAVEEGLTTAYSQFMGTMLNKMVDKIESNYLIANFLYYTDALVAGQYADDYLEKYVNDQVDRQIIKRFIPQFNCGQSPSDLKIVFQAKAKDYVGFDVKSLRPSDPDYYEKLSRMGDYLASPYGWQEYYEGVAEAAKSEAEKAAERELVSPGIKTPRDTIDSAIKISINNITSASRASLNAVMNLGISNAKSFISGFVAQLSQTLVNKFVFKGAVAQGGSLGVLKEQATCVAAAQFKPVLPIDATQYVEPPAPPSDKDLLDKECAKYPRGCDVVPTGN